MQNLPLGRTAEADEKIFSRKVLFLWKKTFS